MNVDKMKKNGYTILAIVVFITLIILLNIFTGMLTERYFLKADLTDTGLYTLSDSAEKYLDELDEVVDIIVLSEEASWRVNTSFEIILNILSNYTTASGGYIRVQYVNPDLNTFDGQKYNNSLIELRDSFTELQGMQKDDIIILGSRRATRISVYDLFLIARDPLGRPVPVGVVADQELIGSLIYILNEGIARIVFITNHQESTVDVFKDTFERTGYVSTSINLALQDIPEDTAVLVSAAPKIDFLSDEIIKLEHYLSQGGNLILLHHHQLTPLPNLDRFMAQWGISIDNKIIFDEERMFVPELGAIGVRVVHSPGLPSTQEGEIFTTNETPVGMFLARPLRAVHTNSTVVSPLVQTFSASSYAKAIGDENVTTIERERGDESGPFNVALSAQRVFRDANNDSVNAVFIVTNITMFDDEFLGEVGRFFSNIFLIANLAVDLNPFGGRAFIPGKEMSSDFMPVSSGATRIILFTMVIALPLVIIGAGIFVWRKRRHQ